MFYQLYMIQELGNAITQVVWGAPFFIIVLYLSGSPTYFGAVFGYNPLGAILDFILIFVIVKMSSVILLKLITSRNLNE